MSRVIQHRTVSQSAFYSGRVEHQTHPAFPIEHVDQSHFMKIILIQLNSFGLCGIDLDFRDAIFPVIILKK